MRQFRRSRAVLKVCIALGIVLVVGGCPPPPPPPGAPVPPPASKFDRAWSAVVGAFADEGVQIVSQDRTAGTVRGTAGDIAVSANVLRQGDGSVRVEFGVSGNLAANPTVKDRVVGSYNRRMGR